jgi:acetyltransferase EpsM
MNGPRDLILIGGGEHAAVAADAAASRPELWRVIGYSDLAETPRMQRLGLSWYPDDAQALPAGAARILALGGSAVSSLRRELARRHAAPPGVVWATVVHASARIAPSAVLGPGTLVCAGAIVNPGAEIGAHVIVNTGAIVEHDCRLGDFVHVAPGAVLGGGVTVGEGTFLGLGCRVRDHLQIGSQVTVGMGAVVLGSVPDGTAVMGIPARPRRP